MFHEVQVIEGAAAQLRVIHASHSAAVQAEAEAAQARELAYKPTVQPGVIGQWKREGQGIWKKYLPGARGLDRIQIQTYNILRDMMNKPEQTDAKKKAKDLSTVNAEQMLEWMNNDEMLLGFKEGETELPARHSQWQLQEEIAAAQHLKKCIDEELAIRESRRKERKGDDSRRDRDRDEDRHDRDKRRGRDRDRDRDRGGRRV